MSLDALNEDFRDVLILFADGEVDFLIVGAYALALHGVPRASGDIDLFVRPTPENAARAYAQLVRFGAPVAALGMTSEDLAKPGLVYQIGLPPRRIDVLTEISGLSFEDAWASRSIATLAGRSIPFIGREAFIRNKHAAGRPKDLADAARLGSSGQS
jgi:hypothetical protein